jgi:hypothetical protein
VSTDTVEIVPPTLTSDGVCGLLDARVTVSSAEKLSADALSGIAIGALLVVAIVFVVYMCVLQM